MKFPLFCLGFLFLAAPAVAQNLSLRSLLKLREQEHAKVEKQLSRRGWRFMSDSKPTAAMMGKAVWAFEPVKDNALAWCIRYYNHDSPTRLLYNLSAGDAFDKIQNQIRRRNMRVLQEGQHLEGVQFLQSYTDYTDGKYVMRLLRYQQPGYFGIKIFDKEDYLKSKTI